VIALALALARAEEPVPGYVDASDVGMATELFVRLPVESADLAATVFARFADVEERANEWRPGSPIGLLNASAGREPVALDGDLAALLRVSLDVAARTDGAFDPTWAALWGLWDFRADPPRVPAADDVATAASHVGYARVELREDGTSYLPDPDMRVGLGGVAKGWALDKAGATLREAGVSSFLLRVGGQVLVGDGPAGRRWRVGIRDPRGDDAFATLDVTNVSVSTSGDYERFFVLDGVRYHHILDPRTGWPARGVTSATVISSDATLADALSTALVVLDPRRAMAVVRDFGVEAVIVRDDGGVLATPGLAGRLTVIHPPGVGP
jgi:thiamine biosynthesis lipoprotein